MMIECTPKELIKCLNECKYTKGGDIKKCWSCKANVELQPCKSFYPWWKPETDKIFRKRNKE